MKYGERLKLVRERAGLTQNELAALTYGSVKQGTISKIERGDQERSTFDIELAVVLDVHPKWLKDEDPRYAPLWFKDGQINEEPPPYDIKNIETEPHQVAQTPKEVMALTLIRSMADFQRDEWLEIGKAKVDLYNKFKESEIK